MFSQGNNPPHRPDASLDTSRTGNTRDLPPSLMNKDLAFTRYTDSMHSSRTNR